jgi:acetyl-CoA carboxylase biotin carboxyl carrier protein
VANDQETLARLADGELRELLQLLDGTDIEELELDVAGTRLLFKRRQGGQGAQPQAEGATEADGPATTPSAFVVAERVGFFHYPDGAAGPLEPGDLIAAGQTLGNIDSLSVPIPLQAPRAGRLAEVLVDDGQAVEYGQPLFVIDAGEAP